MPIAICRLCSADDPLREVVSKVVSASMEEMSVALGQEMLVHMNTHHNAAFVEMVEYCKLFNGFLVMNQYILSEKGMMMDVEKMRDTLAERLMEFSPEDEEVDLDEEKQKQLVEILEKSRDLISQAVVYAKEEGDEEFHKNCGEVMELIDELLDEIDEIDEDEEEDEDDDDDDDEVKELDGKTIEMERKS